MTDADRPLRIVLAGGGTAGHIEPALTLADAVRRRDPSAGVTALGTTKGLETRLVPERGYELALIPAVPLPRRPTAELLTVPARLAGTVRRAAEVLERVQADVVVGFGGYVALPAYLAARRKGVPIVVHEANVRPGLANRVGARMTSYVATGTPDCRLEGKYIGMPLRRSVSQLDRPALRAEACAAFGLDPAKPTMLVYGGSQGARRLNESVIGAAAAFSAAGVQILHAIGRANFDKTERPQVSGAAYVPVPYLDRMDLAYAAADLVLGRGGAMTCAEIAAVGLPAIYVPLPIGNGEQRLNAQPAERVGGGIIVDDAELTPEWLTATALPLALDAAALDRMGRAVAALGRRGADEELCDMVYEAAAAGAPSLAAQPVGPAGAGV